MNGTGLAEGITPDPADPVEAMVRPGEIRATVTLRAGQEAEIEVALLPSGGAPGPVSIRLGVVPAPDEDALLASAEQAACGADAAIVIVGSAPAAESEGFDRPGLALTGRQDELVRRVAAVNDRTIVVVNAGMPVLMPWADEVAAVGYAWLGGQAMGDALADVLLGAVEPGGRLPVTLPAAEADCPVLHAVPRRRRAVLLRGAAHRVPGLRPGRNVPALPVRPRPRLHHLGAGVGPRRRARRTQRPRGRGGRSGSAGRGRGDRGRGAQHRDAAAAGRSSRPTWRPRGWGRPAEAGAEAGAAGPYAGRVRGGGGGAG